MNDKKCFGYYIVKPLIKPEWCTLKTSHILSVSENGFSEKFPALEKCFWVNYPKSNRAEYQRYLQLSDHDFQDFCNLVADLFEHKRLTTDVRFYCMDDVIKIYQYLKYLKNADGYRMIGIFTDSEILDEFDKEGIFDIVKAGLACDNPRKIIGCDILGCESLGQGYFSFDSYLINSLNEELEQLTDHRFIVDARTGLIQNSYEETKQYCGLIQGQGEPVIWTPYEIYEFQNPI